MPQESDFTSKALEWDKILHHLRNLVSSDPGKKLVDHLHPLTDPGKIERLLRINSECQYVFQTSLSFPIHGYSDVGRALKKLAIESLPLAIDEINTVVKNFEIAHRMRSALKSCKKTLPELFALSQRLSSHEKIVKEIRSKIDENGIILDTASPELKRLRRLVQQRRVDLKKRLEALVKQNARKGVLQEDHFTIRNGRYVLPVKESHKRRLPGITHDISSTGATLFVEPLDMVERNNEIGRLKAQEAEEIIKILSAITASLRECAADIDCDQTVLAQLDFHYACGQLASRLDAHKPLITKSNVLKLEKGRHPLLLLNAGEHEDVVPLSVTLGDSFNTLVISGPNAGGKTVSLKTIGLLCLMVQSGLPAPVSADSQFPVFRRIIAEIGDPQSLDENLSTFSARLLNIKSILDNLSENNLILLDELGTGTDPQEGVNLAMGVINYIASSGALMVVTTHHGGLKLFASDTDGVENASLAFNEKSFKPTYQLTVGIPGSSYALELSRRIGLPEEIIEETRRRLGEKQLKIEDFIRELELRISFYTKKNAQIQEQRQKLDELIDQYSAKLANLKKEYHTKLEGAIGESETQMAEFNKRFERLVKEVREKQAAHESIVRAKKVIQQETTRIKRRRKKHEAVLNKLENAGAERGIPPPKEITVGSSVMLKGHNETGIVIAENRRKNVVTVQMNSIKLEVSKDRLHPAQSKSRRTIQTVHNTLPQVSVKPEIDLRGMRAQDALESVDQYLYDALSSGLTSIRIIHGKGTGSLRKSIGEFLKNDDRVMEYRLGSWGEGDTGVTIVQLK